MIKNRRKIIFLIALLIVVNYFVSLFHFSEITHRYSFKTNSFEDFFTHISDHYFTMYGDTGTDSENATLSRNILSGKFSYSIDCPIMGHSSNRNSLCNGEASSLQREIFSFSDICIKTDIFIFGKKILLFAPKKSPPLTIS